ncbi:hypothetical protein [Streptomyces sp. A0592]|uniref:hypothetical protein n=1 Tax=Streptomyces sp. A0592 TaxID=2563099 RepID=UPI00109E4662|nr:hypothetical protein [Streptomyces sp. A0592]THA75441.1 hypothetical protein E6U81_36855 [Streptomyces sp. A0592]
MTTLAGAALSQAAARAALDVPGVIALQPALGERLALAAARAYKAMTSGVDGARGTQGVRGELDPDGTWHLEVRCILDSDHRVVDVARQVRAAVRAATTGYLTRNVMGPTPTSTVKVVVSVTRTM